MPELLSLRHRVNHQIVPVHRLHRRHEAFAGGEPARPHLARPAALRARELRHRWLRASHVHQEHALLPAHQHLLRRVVIPLDGIEVVRLVHRFIQRLHLPRVTRIARLLVTHHLHSRAFARRGFVPTTVQRHHHEIITAIAILHPAHPVNRRLVRQCHRLPALRAVCGRHEIKDRAAVQRVAGVPPRAHRHLALAIAIDVLRGEADVIEWRQLLRHHMLRP